MAEADFVNDPIYEIFRLQQEAYDEFIRDNAKLDRAVRENTVAEWVHTMQQRAIGDGAVSEDDNSGTEGQPAEEVRLPKVG